MSNKTNKTNTNKLNPATQQWSSELHTLLDFSKELSKQCVYHGKTTNDQRSEKITMEPIQYKDYTITLKRYGRTPRYILTGNNTEFEGYWFDITAKLYTLTH